jgi:antitoxin ParD1/3/4
MNVSLTPELERFVQEKVHSGRYTSASEVVREALRLLEEHEKVRATQLTAFQVEIDRRLAALDRGEGIDGETARAQLRQRSQDRQKQRA